MVFLCLSPDWLLNLEEPKEAKMVPTHTDASRTILNAVGWPLWCEVDAQKVWDVAKLFICQFYTGLGIWNCTKHLWLDLWLSLQ